MNKEVEELNNQGVKLFLNSDFLHAKERYKKALEVQPHNATTLNNLGMLYLQEKKFEKAKICFLEAIAEKESSTYLLNLGHVYANLEMYKEAEESYLKSIELNNNSYLAWKSVASLYQFQKRHIESANIWEQIVGFFGGNPADLVQFAKELIEIKEFDRAYSILIEITSNEKFQDVVWYYITIIHIYNKNFGLAEKSINKSLGANPDNEDSRKLAASVYLGLSKLEKAIYQWDILLKYNEDNHEVRTDKAVALLAHGYKKKALEELNKVIIKDRENLKALFYKALIHIELDVKRDEAKEILNRLKENSHTYSERIEELLLKIQ